MRVERRAIAEKPREAERAARAAVRLDEFETVRAFRDLARAFVDAEAAWVRAMRKFPLEMENALARKQEIEREFLNRFVASGETRA